MLPLRGRRFVRLAPPHERPHEPGSPLGRHGQRGLEGEDAEALADSEPFNRIVQVERPRGARVRRGGADEERERGQRGLNRITL